MSDQPEVRGVRGVRGYSWPPFEPGNEAALSHGAFSDRRVNPIADRIEAFYVEQIEGVGTIAYLSDPSFRSSLASLCDTEARVLRLRWFLDDMAEQTGRPGEIDDDGNPRPAALLLLRFEAKAQKDRERLGLDPLGRSKLGRDMAATQADLAAVSRAGAAALAARPIDVIAVEARHDDNERDDDDDADQ